MVFKDMNKVQPMLLRLCYLAYFSIGLSFHSAFAWEWPRDEEEILYLLRNNTLQKLDLSQKNLEPKDLKSIVEALKRNTSLRELDLSSNYLQEGVIAQILDASSSIVTLNLRHNLICANLQLREEWGQKPVEAFAQNLVPALAYHQSLRKLDVSVNRMGNRCASVLAQALQANHAITHVNLEFNEISDSVIIAQFLRHPSIQILNLAWNHVGGNIDEMVLAALAGNTALISLDLTENTLQNKDAKALAKAISTNTTLKKLELGQNLIEAKGAWAIYNALRVHPGVQRPYVSMNDNKIGLFVEILCSAVGACPAEFGDE